MNIKSFFLASILCIISMSCQAYEWFTPLSKQQIKLQAAYISVTVIDWMQTKEFRSKKVKESNPWLGSEPSQEKINLYIGAAIIAHTFVTWALPTKFRSGWIGSFLTIECLAVIHNYQRGYGPKLTIPIAFKF